MVICYEEGQKKKSCDIMRAFAHGCNGKIASVLAPRLLEGDVAMYGCRPPWLHLWKQAKVERRRVYYVDNSYFDVSREKFFRVTLNALQADGMNAIWNDEGPARFKTLGITIHEWQRGGRHVVVCPQSKEFLQIVAGFEGDWEDQAIRALKAHTDRPLRIRKKGGTTPLAADLAGAWALVTHMSAAANEALIAGIPVFVTGRSSAQWMGLSDLTQIEDPLYPENRQEWAEVLAANQWTVDEMRDGTCWRAFEEQRRRGVGHYGR